eukprot:6126194-Prymnesium_polylepis.1
MALSSCAVETTKPCFRDTAASAAVPQAAGMAAASGSRSSRTQAPGDQCTMKGGSPPSSIFENNPFHPFSTLPADRFVYTRRAADEPSFVGPPHIE